MEKYTLNGVNGQLKIYDDKLIISRKGFLAFATQGIKGDKTIPLSSIYSVQFKEGSFWLNGYIQIGLGGSVESTKGIFDATKDENTIMFNKAHNLEASKIKNFIEKFILERNNNSSNNQTSIADEILKFKSLLDSGIISQEEFDKKKQQLLN